MESNGSTMKSNGRKQDRSEKRADLTKISISCPPSPDLKLERTPDLKLERTAEILSVTQLPDIAATPTPTDSSEYFCRLKLGERPQAVICPYCKERVRTDIRYLPGKMTCVMMVVICCAFFPLFWLPLCLDACKDVHHFCPGCCRRIGIRKRY